MNESNYFILNNSNETYTTHLNRSNFSKGNDFEYVPQDTLPLSVIIILIIAGTFGNLLVCLAILLDRKLQNLTNYFLLSLAVTDLLINLLILPGRLIIVRYESTPSTFPLCFLYLVGDDFVTAASAIHICFISFERYLAIRNPLNQRRLTKKRVAVKIGLVWLIAFLTVIPYMTHAIITKHPHKPTFCEDLLSDFIFFEGIVFIEASVIMVMIIVVVVSFILTTTLLHKLAKRQKENMAKGNCGLVRTIGSKTTNEESRSRQRFQVLLSEEKALKVVWIVSFAFIICLTPYTCLSLFFVTFQNIMIPRVLSEITAYLFYLNSVINPVIYTTFNQTFRENFKLLIFFKYKRGQ